MALAAQAGERDRDGCRRDEAVEPVHQAAMTGNEVARILDPCPALQGGFRKGRRPATPRPRHETKPKDHRQIEGARREDLATTAPITAPSTTPTIAPDQVLPGDTRGQSFGPPISRPPK